MSLTVDAFGKGKISLDNKENVSLATRKVEALVYYLVLLQKPHQRDVLAEMFWGNRSQERASGNLRVALSSIRKQLGDYFDISRTEVSVKGNANIWGDVFEFESRMNCARVSSIDNNLADMVDQLKRALRLYDHPFLDGFYINQAEGFDRWLSNERARYEIMVEESFEDLISGFMKLGEYDEGLRYAAKYLALDSLNEKAHRQMITLLSITGQRHKALVQFEECRRILQDELGVEPDAETQTLYEVISSGSSLNTIYPESFPPAREEVAGNLPSPVTSFVGRKKEQTDIENLLSKESSRLITLTGPGGVGKTRLALETSSSVRTEFTHGVWFIDLASISDPTLLDGRIARQLNINEQPDRPVLDSLIDFLRGKKLLMILDNFEQIIPAAKTVSRILSGTRKLKILVTSRESLRVSGEQVYPVSPLGVPNIAKDELSENYRKYESLTLYEHRARALNPDFSLSNNNIQEIGKICEKLDGLPLAIELAAARSSMYTPAMMVEALSNSLDLLSRGPRNSSNRHKKLRETIAWSYGLLSVNEKRLLQKLSVFQGSAELDTIIEICMNEGRTQIVDDLEALVIKNLVVRDARSMEGPRFRMLNTIKQFSNALFVGSEFEPNVRKRHARYYANLAVKAAPELRGPLQSEWSAVIKREYDDLIAALNWSFKDGQPEIALRLVSALGEFWYYEGPLSEAKTWVPAALELADRVDEYIQVKVYNTAGMISFVLGDFEKGRVWNLKALEIAREINDIPSLAWALFWLSAHSTSDPKRYKESFDYILEAIEHFKTVSDQAGVAWAYNQLGEVSRLQKDMDRAEFGYLESLRVARRHNNQRREAIALINLSYVSNSKKNYLRAEREALEGLRILSKLNLVYHSAITLAMLAGPLVAIGQAEKAIILIGASMALFDKLSTKLQPADAVEINQYISEAREAVTPDRYEQLRQYGQQLSFDDAVQYAFSRPTAA